ncbi:MAG: DNA topology modulation protein [Ktedonobacteraceae bacterium]
MEKIVIVGSPGAGKSTLAQALGDILDIEIIHLDRYFWQPGWNEHSRKTRIVRQQQLIREKYHWIIEGTYLSSSEPRLNAADTIIFLDIPPLLCLYRLIKRHIEWRGRSRSDIPEGCTDRLDLKCLLKVFAFPLRGRFTLDKKLRNYPSKSVFQLHSKKEIEDFLAHQVQYIRAKPSSTLVVPEQVKYALATKS